MGCVTGMKNTLIAQGVAVSGVKLTKVGNSAVDVTVTRALRSSSARRMQSAVALVFQIATTGSDSSDSVIGAIASIPPRRLADEITVAAQEQGLADFKPAVGGPLLAAASATAFGTTPTAEPTSKPNTKPTVATAAAEAPTSSKPAPAPTPTPASTPNQNQELLSSNSLPVAKKGAGGGGMPIGIIGGAAGGVIVLGGIAAYCFCKSKGTPNRQQAVRFRDSEVAMAKTNIAKV